MAVSKSQVKPVAHFSTSTGGQGWQWDVVLSFAGAQRGYVEQVAGCPRSLKMTM
jgi:hypothetical protein